MIAALALRAAAPYAIALALAGGGLYGAYAHGVTTTERLYELRIGADALKHARERMSWSARVNAAERRSVDDMAALALTYEKVRADEKMEHERHAADLLNGALRLRKRLAYAWRNAADSAQAGASASSGDADQGVGLHIADAQFLLRIASEADQIADQLRACQAVVRADRLAP